MKNADKTNNQNKKLIYVTSDDMHTNTWNNKKIKKENKFI